MGLGVHLRQAAYGGHSCEARRPLNDNASVWQLAVAQVSVWQGQLLADTVAQVITRRVTEYIMSTEYPDMVHIPGYSSMPAATV